jgi:hypothetical protein
MMKISQMKALLNACVGVVALLAVAGTAQASDIGLGTLSPPSNTLVGGLYGETGPFSIDFTFDVNYPSGSSGVLAGGVYFNWAGTFSQLDLTYGATTFDLLTVGSGNPVSLGNLNNGTYDFTVHGAPTGSSASFGVQISAVPVPAAAWLFGTGLIGLVAVSRRGDAA